MTISQEFLDRVAEVNQIFEEKGAEAAVSFLLGVMTYQERKIVDLELKLLQCEIDKVFKE